MGRVLILGKYYEPFAGGIEANTASIARHLARSHDVTALVNAHSPDCRDETIDGVKIIRRKVRWAVQSQPVSPSMFDGVRLSDYDVIHFHAPNPFGAAFLWTRLFFSPRRPALVITHHMEIYGRQLLRILTLWPYRRLARSAANVIVTSHKNAVNSRDLPASVRPLAIPLGIAVKNYALTPAVREAGVAWRRSIVGDAPAVGFLGRHARYKGLDVMLKALARLPGVHALIAGDGPARIAAEQMAKDLGLADRAHFLGRIDDETKLKLLSSIDAFLFPSTEITEAFGVSQMEAMLCGAPVIAANLPTGVTDVAIDGETALLVEPGSVDELVWAVRRVLADRDLADWLGAAGRRHIVINMDEDVVARQTSAVIERAMSGRPDLSPRAARAATRKRLAAAMATG